MYLRFTYVAKFIFILEIALRAAAPFKSVVELAAEPDVLGTLSVRVAETLILLKGIPNACAANCAILVYVPCPISIAPVLTSTVPSLQ